MTHPHTSQNDFFEPWHLLNHKILNLITCQIYSPLVIPLVLVPLLIQARLEGVKGPMSEAFLRSPFYGLFLLKVISSMAGPVFISSV